MLAKNQPQNLDPQELQVRYLPHTYAHSASRGKWVPFWYLKIIGRAIVEAVEKGGGRMIVLGPPRHGKSLFISHWTPTWFLDRWPHKKVILTTYEANFAASWGRGVRNEFKENPFCKWTKVREDSQAGDWWLTTQGGAMATAGVGGPITGKGGDLIIIDDAIKNDEEANSEIIQERNINWFQTTLYTRLEPKGTIIVFMPLWNKKSLVSWLRTEHPDNWRIFSFPAIALENDPFGRKEGEALCPERFDLPALEQIRLAQMKKDPAHWYGLYQQQIVDPQGGLFKRQWLRYFTDYPAGIYSSYLTVDEAFSTKKTADYTVVMHTKADGHGRLFVHDYVRARMNISELINILFDYKRRIPTLRGVWVEIPPGETETNSAILYAIREEMKRRGVFFRLEGLRPSTNKTARAQALIDLAANGMLFLRESQHELIGELLSFTGIDDEHDDLWDALAYAPMIIRPAKQSKAPQPIVDDDLIGY